MFLVSCPLLHSNLLFFQNSNQWWEKTIIRTLQKRSTYTQIDAGKESAYDQNFDGAGGARQRSQKNRNNGKDIVKEQRFLSENKIKKQSMSTYKQGYC